MTRLSGMIPAEAARARDTHRRRVLLRLAAGAAALTVAAVLALPAVAQEPAFHIRAHPSAAPQMFHVDPRPLDRVTCLIVAARLTGRPVMVRWQGEVIYTFIVATCVPAGEPV
jgi:hypothetical protein